MGACCKLFHENHNGNGIRAEIRQKCEDALCIPVPARRGAFRRARVAVLRGLEPPQGDAARPRPGGRVVPGRRPSAQTGNISRESLMTVPFFGNFDDMSVCGTNLVESIPNRAQLLADAIPAESYATGRNPVPRWGLLGGSTASATSYSFRSQVSIRKSTIRTSSLTSNGI